MLDVLKKTLIKVDFVLIPSFGVIVSLVYDL
jgi:hypothetical protein